MSEFGEKIAAISRKVLQYRESLLTEEATKTSLIMPFIANVLGYDVFDPNEVVPELVMDVGLKKGEKIDYAIMRDGQVQMLMECKKVGEQLRLENASQLFRYFHVTSARIACLTNGQVYRFYTDLDAPNKMDEKPFLELDLENVDDRLIEPLQKLTKESFDLESVINSAEELKYLSAVKRAIGTLFADPPEDLVRVFASRIYDGVLTQRVREQFAGLVRSGFKQYVSDNATTRLRAAIGEESYTPRADPPAEAAAEDGPVSGAASMIETTEEEQDAFHIIRAIGCSEVTVDRITMRDAKAYCAVLLDDNNRRTICRLHFNRAQKYLGLFDADKLEARQPITQLADIYQHAETIRETIRRFASGQTSPT